MQLKTKNKKRKSGRFQPKPDLQVDEPVKHPTQARLFPGRTDMMITLMELATATEISATRLRDWAKKGRIPGGVRPAERCRWEFQREIIERWWAGMLGAPNQNA
jgi:hypothetical protein